jgi:hypothetical protein
MARKVRMLLLLLLLLLHELLHRFAVYETRTYYKN